MTLDACGSSDGINNMNLSPKDTVTQTKLCIEKQKWTHDSVILPAPVTSPHRLDNSHCASQSEKVGPAEWRRESQNSSPVLPTSGREVWWLLLQS